ncbi:MAG: hypothetical protein LBK71_00470 [Verrucomicrobiales bacterium]|jgi:hypothetical protein|nr:hypothetical protein [Verrucomicrobiales bacterium]
MNTHRNYKTAALTLALGLTMALTVTGRAADWKLAGDAAESSLSADQVTLSLSAGGTVSAAREYPVKAGAAVALSFNYLGGALGPVEPLTVTVRWLTAEGKNIDDDRAPLGFPPLARTWTFTKNDKTAVAVADTVITPDRAAKALVALTLARDLGGRAASGPVKVTVSGFQLKEGEIRSAGLELGDSGPADAGPLSAPPDGVKFPENLVTNGALEEGAETPTGWKIEGDNRGGAAEWVTGGAFSGQRALKVSDRGPFVKSWERQTGDPYVPGGKPGGGWVGSREEVSARWVSEPVPAEPGRVYQAQAFVWLANRANYDRLMPSPIRIQFLDKNGNVLHNTNIHNDLLPDARMVTRDGWVFVITRPNPAPAGTVALRAAVVMHHAAFTTDATTGAVSVIADNRNFYLVDNISVYPLPADTKVTLDNAEQARREALSAGLVPFVPSSPAHRPNTFNVEVKTQHAGGVIVVPRDNGGAAPTITLSAANLLGDPRTAEVTYTLVNIDDKKLGTGTLTLELPPFGAATADLALPPGLPYGPYLLEYVMQFKGEAADGAAGSARFGLVPPRADTLADHARLDYPFSLWMPGMGERVFGTPDEEAFGQFVQTAGAGKTWFGAGGIYVSDILRHGQGGHQQVVDSLAKKIEQGQFLAEHWKKYNVQPLGRFEPSAYVVPEAEWDDMNYIVETYTRELGKVGVNFWRWGTEFTHGGAVELDRDRYPEGQHGVQGQQTYLNWGRQGTLRQYYKEYAAAYAAAKRGNPDCRFGPQSASDVQGNVLKAFFQLCTNKQIDSFGMNTYISAFSIWPPNVYQLTKNGVPDLPIFISEFGAQGTSPIGADHLAREKKQCGGMVTYWTTMLQAFPTLCHVEMWGMSYGDDDGSLTYRGAARPPYYAYAVMTSLLGPGKFTDTYQLPGASVYVRQYSTRPGVVAVVWAKEPDTQVELNVGGDRAELYDLFGNLTPLTADKNCVTVSAGPDPVYVVSANGIKPGTTVELKISHATRERGQYRVSVSVTNKRDEAISGSLELIADGPLKVAGRERAISQLAPGAAVEEVFKVTPIGKELRDKRVTVRARLTVGDKVYQLTAPLNFHAATRGAAPISDAQAPAWDDRELQMAANRADQFANISDANKPWGGPTDISVQAGFRWDDVNLYAMFRVTDDVFCPPEGQWLWHRDIIELLIDTNRTLTLGPNYTMLSLGLLPDGARAQRWDGKLPGGDVPGGKLSVTRQGVLTVYEAAIPWKEIDPAFKPAAGGVISLAWSVDEYDGPGTGRRAMSWFSLAHAKNPSEFGDLLLVE